MKNATLLTALAALAIAASAVSCKPSHRLTILHLNDTHSHFEPVRSGAEKAWEESSKGPPTSTASERLTGRATSFCSMPVTSARVHLISRSWTEILRLPPSMR